MRIAPSGRGAFPKVAVFILISLGILLYIPFIFKALLPSAIITSSKNTPSRSTIPSTVVPPPDTTQIKNKQSLFSWVTTKKVDPAELKSRCWGTQGSWCHTWLRNLINPIPAISPPKYNKSCLWDCNGVGVCDYSTGWCRCPAGWDGDACDVRMRRPCSQRYRTHGFEPYDSPTIDWNEPFAATLLCTGQCDDDIGMCFCNSTSKYGRIPANITDPPKTPPIRYGRQLGNDCQPNFNPTGGVSEVGNKSPDDIYGVDGWCEADINPKIECECFLDGLLGQLCDVPVEHFCANQCSGHGECYLGWCQCHKGYYGHDCAYRLSGIEWDNGLVDGLVSSGEAGTLPMAVLPRHWLADVAHTPAAQDILQENSSTTTTVLRHRPLIYVYELPSKYNQLMLQYRFQRYSCTHRLFEIGNTTSFLDSWNYQAETAIHEMLLQSKHRTLDPEEADFFYMPVYISCFYWPVFGAADHPWFHGGPSANRVSQGTNLLIDMWNWVQSHRPYWYRNNGRDHILLVTHDEGSCHVPAVLRNATILTHWGRKDEGHRSGSAYPADVYSEEVVHPVYQPEGHLKKLGSYACYDPNKDLVIPPMYSPLKYYYSPLHGAPEHNRTMLAFFKGDLRIQDNRMIYSRGIRQKLTKLRMENQWWSKYKIWIGQNMPGDKEYKDFLYGEALASSIFCFVLPGDGWSGRFEDSIMHGCIPVIIQDEVDVSFESLFSINEFSIRIEQKDMEKIPEILQNISTEKVEKLQKGVKKVMNRYWYGSYTPHAALSQMIKEDWEAEIAGNNSYSAAANVSSSPVSVDASNNSTAEEGKDAIGDILKGIKDEKRDKESTQQRREKFMTRADLKLRAIDGRMNNRMQMQGSAAFQVEKRKKAVDTSIAPIRDDAFETILAFLTEKMSQWEQEESNSKN